MITSRFAYVQPTTSDHFANLIADIDPISLQDLDRYRLLDRVDTKFVLRDWQLLDILQRVMNDYFILDTTHDRINRYRTLYFDTPDLAFYAQHHNDVRKRRKVRCRQYIDSGLNFLEVKFKTDRQRTIKSRLRVPEMVERLEGESLAFVAEHCPHLVDRLNAVIWNSFSRITLVSKYRQERLTLDIGYRHSWQDGEGSLPGIAIAEVKQRKFSFESDFLQQLRPFNIRSTGFSKYCTGIADIYPQVKYNRFKRRFLMLERLSHLKDSP
jgi:hypothetical protein